MNKIDGLGTPDSFDNEAIVKDILNLVRNADTSKFVYTTYDRDLVTSVKESIIQSITDRYRK